MGGLPENKTTIRKMPELKLKQLGWSDFFANASESYQRQGFNVGRVIIENRDCYSVLTEKCEINAEVAGRLLFTSESPADLPKVGDWVVLQLFADGMAIIHDILPRKTKFSRKVAGKKFDEQVMATNIDVIFIVQGLDNNFNPRRLERTLVMVNESGVKPVIILNKSDLCESTQDKVEQTKEILKDIPIIAVSAKENKGINELKSFLKEGETFAFIGSSGVGKSTLINKLVGQDILKMISTH